MKEYSIGTKCVQAGYAAGNGEPRQIPIIQSTTFKYDTSEDMGKLFDLEAEGYFYSRLQNPTCDTVARKSQLWRVALLPCSHHQARQPISMPCSTYVSAETISWHHHPSMEAPSTSSR